MIYFYSALNSKCEKNITELIRLQTANEVNENSMKFKGYLGEVEKVKRVMQVMQGIAG